MENCFIYRTDAANGKWHSSAQGFTFKLKAKQQFEGFVVRNLLPTEGEEVGEWFYVRRG